MPKTDTRPPQPATADRATTGPMARVVVASLTSGLLVALALMLGVFAGGREHAVTGGALLGFSAGWALLAVLSQRFTTQPQRWALVPASVMAASGIGLLVLAPGQEALTSASWVWPPALLALSIWCIVRARKTMSSKVRILVYVPLAALAIGSVGGVVESVALAHDRDALAPPGQRYDIGQRKLHIQCSGTGSPTVVLIAGTGAMSSSWARIAPGVATTTRVCAYDRAGQGWSDDAPHPQDALEMAADLRKLLEAADEHGPYVLAGHSLGGVYGMAFAARYPVDVAGLVLLDSSSPEQFTALPDYPGEYEMLRRFYSVTPAVARFGLGRLMSSRVFSSLPQPAAGQVRAFESSSRGLENARDDVSEYRAAFRQARELRSLGGKPLAVITARGSLRDTAGWAAAQDKMTELSPNVVHRVVEASHGGMLDSIIGAQAAATAINEVVGSLRTGVPLTARS